jgi:hypothetical protein
MFPSARPRFGSLVAGAGLCILLATVSSCSTLSPPSGGGSSGAGGESEAANLSVLYDFPSQGAPKCTGSITWIYAPISLTGFQGNTEKIQHHRALRLSVG